MFVGEPVTLEMLQEPETPPTLFTLKRPLPSVDADMFPQVALVIELPAAVLAFVGFQPRVDQHVFLQGGRPGEAPPTLRALMWSVCHGCTLVSGQLGAIGKVLAAERAARRLHCVCVEVYFQC